jgi:Methylamine utilisation protein MauE
MSASGEEMPNWGEGPRVCLRGLLRGRFIPVLLGLLLLTAGGLKGYQLASTGLMPEDKLLGGRGTILGLIAFELALGLWLLSGFANRAARLVSLTSFSVFLGVSLARGLAGEVSCGCFGPVALRPWVAALVDLFALVHLCMWTPTQLENAVHGARPRAQTGLAALSLVTIALAAYPTIRPEPARLSENGEILGDGHVVVLEPRKWVGKRCPLLKHIDIGSRLAVGNWIVVLYRRGCHQCQQAIERYHRWRDETGLEAPEWQMLFLEVPWPGEELSTMDRLPLGSFAARLTTRLHWSADLPIVLHLKNGYVDRIQTREKETANHG